MTNFLKLADWNVGPLVDQIDRSSLWNANGWRKTLSAHRQMDDIWVRYNDVAPFVARGDFAGFNDKHVPIWYPAWSVLTELRPIVFDLMALVDGEMIGGVLITRVPSGGGIDRHVDAGWHVDYFDKFYVCLRGAEGATFSCEHDGAVENLTPRPGEVHRFDNRKPHWVENHSGQDRMTLIVCIRTEKFLHAA
jgi:hypothetical protein